MRKMIFKSSLLRRLKNTEHYDLHEGILSQVGDSLLAFPSLQKPYYEYRNAFERQKRQNMINQRAEETEKLEDIDKERNSKYLWMKKAIVYLYDEGTPQRKRIFRPLMDLILNYKGVNRVAYTEKSAYMTIFLEQLAEKKYATAIKMSNLGDTIDELNELNSNFKELYRLRTEKTYRRKSHNNAHIRKKTDEALHQVIEMLYGTYLLLRPIQDTEDDVKKIEYILDTIYALFYKMEEVYEQRVPGYRRKK